MKSAILLLVFSGVSQGAVVATVAVTNGGTFTKLSSGGGGGTFGTRIGLASNIVGNYTVAGTSNDTAWTITGAGTLTVTYFLDNTVVAPFRLGIQGLYDGSTIATTPGGVETALGNFASLSGVTATYPTTYTSSMDDGAGTVGAPAEQFTTTYVIAPGSAAIGKSVAVGFYSAWSNTTGGYIFGKESGANDVVLDFSPVPEPSAALLGMTGSAMLLRRRR